MCWYISKIKMQGFNKGRCIISKSPNYTSFICKTKVITKVITKLSGLMSRLREASPGIEPLLGSNILLSPLFLDNLSIREYKDFGNIFHVLITKFIETTNRNIKASS
jgi:hypothetical protein